MSDKQDHFHLVFVAADLMTEAENLFCWNIEEDNKDNIIREAVKSGFDIVPIRKDNKITHLLIVTSQETENLNSQWLLSGDTAIPDLLRLFLNGSPAFLVYYGQEVIGLVSLADLNKIEVRLYIYHLIGELELSLMEFSKTKLNSDQELLQLLGKKRRKEIEKLIKELKQGNALIDPFSLLNLSDLITIVEKSDNLRSGLGFVSRKEVEKATSGLNVLLNQTMHLVKPLIKDMPEDLNRLHERIRRAEDILIRINKKRGNKS